MTHRPTAGLDDVLQQSVFDGAFWCAVKGFTLEHRAFLRPLECVLQLEVVLLLAVAIDQMELILGCQG